jgi:hypothetical protein
VNALRRPLHLETAIAVGVLCCFVVLGWLDHVRTVRAVERFDTYSSYDFQQGGFHAWFDLLRREGVRVDRYTQRPAYLSDVVATLIVANNVFDTLLRQQSGQAVGRYSSGDYDRLRRWVQSGGRLVWLADQSSAMDVSFFSPLPRAGVAPAATSLRLPFIINTGRAHHAAVALMPSPLTDGVTSISGSSSLRIPFNASPQVTPLVADDHGSIVAWYGLGKGTIVVVTDETLFDNARLGRADNARLAFNIATYGLNKGQTVAFEEWSHGYQSGDTWWTVLPRTFQVAIALTATGLALLLFGAMWRFGPPALPADTSERTSEEYVHSMAALLERGRAARSAVRDLAQIALHAAARSVGLPDATPATAIATRLRGSDAGDRRAHDLITLERLAAYEHPTTSELVQAARLSHTLRKDLSVNGSIALQPRRSAARRSA